MWNLYWIALLLLSFIWTSAFHLYEPASILWVLLLLAAALTLGYFGFRRRKAQRPSRSSTLKKTGLWCGLVLLCQGLVFPFYCILAARHHTEGVFAPLAGGILRLFGVETASQGGTLYLDAFTKTIPFASNWEKVGIITALLFLAGGIVTLLMQRARPWHYAALVLGTLCYTLIRYAFLLMVFITYPFHSLFWERTVTLLTWLPLGLLFALLFRGRPEPTANLMLRGYPRRRSVITGVLAALLAFSLVSFFGLHDPGIAKEGRVLVDEYHSDWEWTTDAYDQEWFGERSGYNYYCFYNYLEHFYETNRSLAPIGADTLRDVDVFIMKTPTRPFTQEEVLHMISFVEEGGGLYLIGDHTNVFGTGANLNQISTHFGLTFRYDCTYELQNGTLSEYDRPILLPHPSVSRLPHFLFATTNTLGAIWQAEEIMLGYGLKNLQADYSQKNFFPYDTNSAQVEFGLFLQSAGVQYGKGRVLAFTDSTVFSNFWMFMPGKPELLLGSMEWLNHRNTFIGFTPREVSAVLILVFLLANLFWWVKHRKAYPLAIFLLAGIGSMVFSSGVFHVAGRAASPLPEPRVPFVQIAFDREYSQFALPSELQGFMANMDEQLNTFYVWTQRLGYVPHVENKLLDALQSGDLAVMVKPGRPVRNPQKVLALVEDGGRLLILDHLESGGHSNVLLASIGMELREADMGEVAAYGPVGTFALSGYASAIQGGEALIRDEKGNVVCAVQQVGEGIVALFSDPDLFYSYAMGDVSANLTERTKTLADLEFRLLEYLVEGKH